MIPELIQLIGGEVTDALTKGPFKKHYSQCATCNLAYRKDVKDDCGWACDGKNMYSPAGTLPSTKPAPPLQDAKDMPLTNHIKEYGANGPSWLPPGSDATLMQTIDDWLNTAAQPPNAAMQDFEFNLRGFLASELLCWHRLTEAEAQDIVRVFVANQSSIAQPELTNGSPKPSPSGRGVIKCAWTEQDDDYMPGTYESACGETWSFVDGGVKENNIRFCHGCGKAVQIAKAAP